MMPNISGEPFDRGGCTSQIEPWDRVLALLKKYSPVDQGATIFNVVQSFGGGLQGFIVCLWSESDREEPSSFWGAKPSWKPFGDDEKTSALYPKICSTLKEAFNFIKRCRDEGQERVGLALWKHDRIPSQPLGEYLLLKDFPFLSCPYPRGRSKS
jgi:hypothetical protein